MSAATDLREQIKLAPDLPGVYLYRGPAGDVIYVGKALSLRRRLANYLPAAMGADGPRVGAKEREMVSRAASLEWIVTSNEVEALLLEHNLIKQHRPPFNIRLRDDKSYPYIMITMEDEYPRVLFTRQPHRKGNLYFGPYASAAKVRETLDVLGRVFPVRTCRGREPGQAVGVAVPAVPHRPLPGSLRRQRREGGVPGRHRPGGGLPERARDQGGRLACAGRCSEAAKRQDFESAAVFRDRLEALTHVLERQQIESGTLGSADIAGLAVDEWGANVQVFITRDGKLADRRSFTLVNVEGADEEEIFERFVAEYYSTSPTVPTELIVPPGVHETEALAAFLEGLRGTRVEVRQAERGDKRRLQEMADAERRPGAGSRAAEGRPQPGAPLRGADRAGAGAGVWQRRRCASRASTSPTCRARTSWRPWWCSRAARPRRATTASSPSRPPAARTTWEPCGRCCCAGSSRAARGRGRRSYDPSFEAVPDLVMVDGGKPQLGAAVAALRRAGPGGRGQRGGAGQAGGGAVRALVSGTASRGAGRRRACCCCARCAMRPTASLSGTIGPGGWRRRPLSILDQLPGIGEKRKKAIVTHFGSPERFLEASREELEAVPGLPGKVAREVYAYVHKTG